MGLFRPQLHENFRLNDTGAERSLTIAYFRSVVDNYAKKKTIFTVLSAKSVTRMSIDLYLCINIDTMIMHNHSKY